MKVSKKDQNALHAAVDEIIASTPEAATALSTLFAAILQSATAVTVSGKKGGKKSTKVSADNDDIDNLDADEGDGEEDEDGEDGETEEDDDDDVEDLENVKPRGKGKGKPAKEEETDEPEELEDIGLDTIMTYFNSLEGGDEVHERVGDITGIKELSAMVDEFGFDAESVIGKAKALAEKRAALKAFLSDVHTTIDQIMLFELDSVVEAVEEATGESFKPAGRKQADKELSAATALFTAAVAAEE